MKFRCIVLVGTSRYDVRAASSGATSVAGRPNANVPPAVRAVTAVAAPLAKSAVPTMAAFTLMEVMIAIAVFCIGAFAILGLVASVMRDARLLDKPMVDAGVVASQIAQTNKLVEITGTSGDLSEFLGDNYKGYDYVYEIDEVESNRLFHAQIAVTSEAPGKPVISKMDILLFRPLSPPGSMDFGYMQH